ncbi:glycosyl hydrolase [Galbibacter sp. PAP.153]|uniref:glycosyl hydrolase n=1 Tax=Galbibacter sp. PAP.153 TaxID=3104623 RepID=UPI0030093819
MQKKYFINSIMTLAGALTMAQNTPSSWPEVTKTQRTWTRWWWMGNAVDATGIKYNLEALSKAGIGGVEITPIYGVRGEEDNFIGYLSPKWIQMLDYTVHIADSLQMGVDMTLGTGWPYGGPQVEISHAAKKIVSVKKELKKGGVLHQYIGDSLVKGNTLKLKGIYAYGVDNNFIDLTRELSYKKKKWIAKNQPYNVYIVYQAPTGQQVKRAAPGGKGYTLDHYSETALNDYVVPFNKALSQIKGEIRAVFNDSYEVYGTDFTSRFFEEFHKRRGYDLKPYLNRLLDKENSEASNRIRSDYRETLSDLLLEEFDRPWTVWAHQRGFKTKLQAHGSPGNLIDLYASADIPECETFGSMPYDIPGFRREPENIREGDADPAMLKFSSSAAHISGKPLVSAETFTWLRDHFKTALSQCKPEAEDLLVNGINHIFLHGSTYSPPRAAWPGWKFYASVNFNYNNTIWEDAPGLFSYIARCQSFLQQGKPDNEVLLYYPIYDTWNKYLKGDLFFQFKIHSLNEWLTDTSFYKTNKTLTQHGYATDYISDRFIERIQVKDKKIILPGGTYKALVVPDCELMPLKTLQKLIALQKEGAHIIFQGIPNSIPGYFDVKEQEQKLKELTGQLTISSNLFNALAGSNVKNESLVFNGLKYIRRDMDGEKIYYIVNHTNKNIYDVPLNFPADQVTVYNPLNGKVGKARITSLNTGTKVKLTIAPGQAYILKTGLDTAVAPWVYTKPIDEEIEVKTPWKLTFKQGGPEIQETKNLSKLISWTALGDEKAVAFSGTGIYETTFELNKTADYWELDLGQVRESAKVWINNQYVGIVWALPFKIKTNLLKKGKNKLKVQVTNLPANRIKALEESGQEWKVFYEINMVDKDYKKFDATQWKDTPSGLLGPVRVTPLKED